MDSKGVKDLELRFELRGLGFRVWGLGCRVWGTSFCRVQGQFKWVRLGGVKGQCNQSTIIGIYSKLSGFFIVAT